jgi:hypothetical protein
MSELHQEKNKFSFTPIAEMPEWFRTKYKLESNGFAQYAARLTLHDTATIFVRRGEGSDDLKEVQCEDHELHGHVIDTPTTSGSSQLPDANYIFLCNIEVKYDGEIAGSLDFAAVPYASLLNGELVQVTRNADTNSC